MVLYIFLLYFVLALTWTIEFLFQTIAGVILYKTLRKMLLETFNCGIVSDQHCNTSKWRTFKCAFVANHLFHFF